MSVERYAEAQANDMADALAVLLVESGLWRWGGDIPGDAFTLRITERCIELLGDRWLPPGPAKRTIRSERQKLIERDGGNCRHCLITGDDLPPGQVLHVDHIVPIARGGSEDLANKQLLCPVCNISKGAS